MKRELVGSLPETRWPAPAWLVPMLGDGGSGKSDDPSSGKDREGLDDELEAGLDDTFPASDPVSVSQTTTTGAPDEFAKGKDRKKGEKEADDS